MRRKFIGAKYTTESADLSVFELISGRGAFSTAVKVHCEVGWSVEKGECWDE
jgi:hypothetical protein